MATYSYKVAELDHLEAIAHSVGIMEGPKRSEKTQDHVEKIIFNYH